MELISSQRKLVYGEIETDAIKQAIVASIVLEQAMLRIIDPAKRDLRNRCKILLSSARNVQNFFQYHPDSSVKYTELFRKEFLSNNIVLYGELLSTVYGLQESDLEMIIQAIKDNIEKKQE